MTKTYDLVQAAAKEALDGRAEPEPQLREPSPVVIQDGIAAEWVALPSELVHRLESQVFKPLEQAEGASDIDSITKAVEGLRVELHAVGQMVGAPLPKAQGAVPGEAETVQTVHGDNTDEVLEHYRVEIKDDSNGFYHRLVHTETGRATNWATYIQIAILDDVASLTDYYCGVNELELRPIHAVTALKQFGVGEAQ